MTEKPEVTVIQLVRGHEGGGARRSGLSDAQRAGETCLVCDTAEHPDFLQRVGWIGGTVAAVVHSYHLGQWQAGESIKP